MALMGDFKKDSAGWNHEFNNPKGMTGNYLASQAKSVERVAKTLVNSKTGRLAASIEAGPVTGSALGLEVDVTAHAPYALIVHEGTAPHTISPEGSVMVFPSTGGLIFTQEVHHPGTKGDPYLNDALIVVTRHWDRVAGTP